MVNDFSIIEFTFQALVQYTSKTDGLRFYEIDILIYVCGLNTCQWFNIVTCLSHPKRRHTSSIVSFHPPDSTPSTALCLYTALIPQHSWYMHIGLQMYNCHTKHHIANISRKQKIQTL